MATFYQRLQLYKQRPDAVHFSNKKIKLLHNGISTLYDRKATKPIVYTKSIENGKEYMVRLYPDSFTATIDGLIERTAKEIQTKQIFDEASKRYNQTLAKLADRQPRQRKPITKTKMKVYAGRKYDNSQKFTN